MKIAVKDLRANPFRDLKNYPIDQSKVDALVASIKDTSFWDNLLCRKAPEEPGAFQLAYGEHRRRALLKAGVAEIDIPARNLSNTEMVKIMAHENQVEWGHNAITEQETIRVVVKAFGTGTIDLPTVPRDCPKTKLRAAPSFHPQGDVPQTSEERHYYTAGSLAKFLSGDKAGWPESKIEAILKTLATIEEGLVDTEQLRDLTTFQADKIAEQARRVAKETGDKTLAKNIGRNLAEGMRPMTGRKSGRGGVPRSIRQPVNYHNAKRMADEMMGSHRRKTEPKDIPPIERFAEALCKLIGEAFPSSRMEQKLEAVTQYREHLSASHRNALVRSLRNLAARATKLADKLES
jgi:hypothetical protein